MFINTSIPPQIQPEKTWTKVFRDLMLSRHISRPAKDYLNWIIRQPPEAATREVLILGALLRQREFQENGNHANVVLPFS